MQRLNVIITGTGGQGIVLLTRVLGTAAIKAGLRVRVGEIHGVSQRGGSVLSFVRMGDEVYSPTVPIGGGDVLIGLEPVEALRSLKYIAPKGLLVLNTRPVLPNTVKTGRARYPDLDDILRIAGKSVGRIIHLDAARVSTDAGAPGAQNMVLLGIFAGAAGTSMAEGIFKEAIQEMVHQTFVRENLVAFELGSAIGAREKDKGPEKAGGSGP